MAMLVPVNVQALIYRTSNAAAPYPTGTPAATVGGHLRDRVQDGRYGAASWLKWTHELLLPPGTDVRDAYNSQLDPARNNNNADTVVIAASKNASKTAFYVVFVEVVSRGTPFEYLRVYLDRFAPSVWPDDVL